MTFVPRLDILPPCQRRQWPELAPLAPAGFVLYGGTAIALRRGHRVSVDFDFSHSRPLDRAGLDRALPWLRDATVLQDQPDAFTVLTAAEPETAHGVKISFFGGLALGRVGEPDLTGDGVAWVASPLDLLATKLNVLLQRAERKDYLDVAELLDSSLTLARGLAAARALHGTAFPISEALKALVFSDDGDLSDLPSAVRRQLEEAVRAVEEIPGLARLSPNLSPCERLG